MKVRLSTAYYSFIRGVANTVTSLPIRDIDKELIDAARIGGLSILKDRIALGADVSTSNDMWPQIAIIAAA
jgi:hypothetical protein